MTIDTELRRSLYFGSARAKAIPHKEGFAIGRTIQELIGIPLS